MRSITEFHATYSELSDPIDTEEQSELQEAGVHIINELGFIAVVGGLIQKYGQTVDYWLDSELEMVYRLLLLDYRNSKVQHNLAGIKKRKAEQEAKKKK